MLGELENDACHGGTQDFPDTDLLGSLLGNEGGKTEQAEACNHHRESGEEAKHLPQPLLGTILNIELLVDELRDERKVRPERLPAFFENLKRFLQVPRRDPDRHSIEPSRIDQENDRGDLLVERLEMEILHDTDDPARTPTVLKLLPDRLLRRLPADGEYRGLIQEERIRRVACEIDIKVTPGCEGDLVRLHEVMVNVDVRHARRDLLHLAANLSGTSLRIKQPARRDAAGNRHVRDTGLGQQLIAQRGELLTNLCAGGEIHHHLFVEPEVLLPNKFQLVEHDPHADDQSDGDRELADNQNRPEGQSRFPALRLPFQDLRWLECREEKGGIAAGYNTDQTGNAKEH